MKIFSGFPNGKLQVTPLPDLFFSELVPSIDDLAELKLTLHLFWLLAHPARRAAGGERKQRAPYVTESELRADRTLMQSLSTGGDPLEALASALAKATERGTLLRLTAAGTDGNGDAVLFFLNTESGRREYERLERQLPPGEPGAVGDQAQVGQRPDIFSLYEQNIGLLTPLIAEDLKDAEREYPADWIEDAFRIALNKNVRRFDYIRAILKRWRDEGRADQSTKPKHWWNDEYDEFVNR